MCKAKRNKIFFNTFKKVTKFDYSSPFSRFFEFFLIILAFGEKVYICSSSLVAEIAKMLADVGLQRTFQCDANAPNSYANGYMYLRCCPRQIRMHNVNTQTDLIDRIYTL